MDTILIHTMGAEGELKDEELILLEDILVSSNYTIFIRLIDTPQASYSPTKPQSSPKAPKPADTVHLLSRLLCMFHKFIIFNLASESEFLATRYSPLTTFYPAAFTRVHPSRPPIHTRLRNAEEESTIGDVSCGSSPFAETQVSISTL